MNFLHAIWEFFISIVFSNGAYQILMLWVFFALYAVGNLPRSIRTQSLWGRLLLNIGSKAMMLPFFVLLGLGVEVGVAVELVMCASAMLAIAFSLHVGNYSRFFARTDLTQSVSLVIFLAHRDSAFAANYPHMTRFLLVFFVPYAASNAILIAAEFFMEKKCGKGTIHLEDFHNLWVGEKIVAVSLLAAMMFLIGIPPLTGFAWRAAIVKSLIVEHRGLTIGLILCFISLGYTYFKWILAIFKTVPAQASQPRARLPLSTELSAKLLMAGCTAAIVYCCYICTLKHFA
ncbi:MAG: hypothetical protein LBT64_01120 [Puniceicoccales bacterium]|jgi:NADH:ubiquinone oxidoreductase subunit 2 (subunit N)|nr:hypothetical protein [Puniceicoccales bacterium]